MKTVFLDLDGTLTDPKIGITRSVIHALDSLGHPAPHADDLEWVIGPPLLESFAKLGVADPQAALDLYRQRYTVTGLFENSLYSGVIDCLNAIQASGYRMCLATAKPHAYARRITAHFGLSEFLSHEFGPELDGTRNDKGALLAYAQGVTGAKSEHSVMVGDRIHDIRAARAVGMKAIGVTWGYGGPDETARADRVCDRPDQLADTVATLLGG